METGGSYTGCQGVQMSYTYVHIPALKIGKYQEIRYHQGKSEKSLVDQEIPSASRLLKLYAA